MTSTSVLTHTTSLAATTTVPPSCSDSSLLVPLLYLFIYFGSIIWVYIATLCADTRAFGVLCPNWGFRPATRSGAAPSTPARSGRPSPPWPWCARPPRMHDSSPRMTRPHAWPIAVPRRPYATWRSPAWFRTPPPWASHARTHATHPPACPPAHPPTQSQPAIHLGSTVVSTGHRDRDATACGNIPDGRRRRRCRGQGGSAVPVGG